MSPVTVPNHLRATFLPYQYYISRIPNAITFTLLPPSISGPAPSLRPLGDPVFGSFLASTKGDSENCRIWRMPDHTLSPPSISAMCQRRGGGKNVWNSADGLLSELTRSVRDTFLAIILGSVCNANDNNSADI